jgi:hypothetical protein
VERGLERVKVKNLNCEKSLPGNGLIRHSILGKGIVGALVNNELWK